VPHRRGPSPEPHLAVTDRTAWQQAESMGCCQVGDEDMVSSPGGMLFQLRGFGRYRAHLMTCVWISCAGKRSGRIIYCTTVDLQTASRPSFIGFCFLHFMSHHLTLGYGGV